MNSASLSAQLPFVLAFVLASTVSYANTCQNIEKDITHRFTFEVEGEASSAAEARKLYKSFSIRVLALAKNTGLKHFQSESENVQILPQEKGADNAFGTVTFVSTDNETDVVRLITELERKNIKPIYSNEQHVRKIPTSCPEGKQVDTPSTKFMVIGGFHGEWYLYVFPDGSGELRYGSAAPNYAKLPSKTFDMGVLQIQLNNSERSYSSYSDAVGITYMAKGKTAAQTFFIDADEAIRDIFQKAWNAISESDRAAYVSIKSQHPL